MEHGQQPPKPAAIGEPSSHTLGNTATVKFLSFGDKEVKGKVDTGATTSSLDAHDIKADGNRVSFVSPALSDNVITLDLVGSQDVRSADTDGESRPIVKLSVEINGVPVENAMFNLNDRSGMDSPILIGQNILQAGDFTVDVNKSKENVEPDTTDLKPDDMRVESAEELHEAIRVIARSNITVAELLQYIQTEAVNRIKD